jgi:hypothetical protein
MFTIPKALCYYYPAYREGAIVILEGYQRAAIASLAASYSYHMGEGEVAAYNKALKEYLGTHWTSLNKRIYIKQGVRCKA